MSSHLIGNANLMVVIDPLQEQPLALEHAVGLAKLIRQNGVEPRLHVLFAVDLNNSDTSMDNPYVTRDAQWFYDRIDGPLRAAGIEHTIELSWCRDWYQSIVSVANRHDVASIMLPVIGRPRIPGLLFNESIWHLLRSAGRPVTLMRRQFSAGRKTVLAAVRFQSYDEEYRRLNQRIVDVAHWIAANEGAELHLVNAYEDSLHYPDRTQLAKSGIDSSRIHVVSGNPDDVIASVASEIGADTLVLGARARPSRWRGATSERIMAKTDCDILVVNDADLTAGKA